MKQHLYALGALVVLMHAPAWSHSEKPHDGKANLAPAETPFGRTGDPAKVARTITIDMRDALHFSLKTIRVRQGETIRIVARNRGKAMHEIVLGTEKELAEHAELMKKFPDMEHDEPYMAHVAPGKRGEIVWQFDRPGTFRFACLIAGHTWNDLRAGMVGTIVVSPRQPS